MLLKELSPKIEKALNDQVEMEAASSQYYLAMASWSEVQGYNGIAQFLYRHSDEERAHMLKLLKFINERGGHGLVPALKEPTVKFKNINAIFEHVFSHELLVSKEINSLVDMCLNEKDYATHNFLQWYVTEQIEEERLARYILDKLKLIGEDKGGLYIFDRDLATLDGNDRRSH
ncbi:ferritin [Chitinophaga nivalis]|uniref:Ferritin n=1 Tax=Chitinophaga nivalis TaxID=2991709 RepID=A0ABT3IV84_9BACT|nr:ferritin [Chitinophaga nivalis]MCW3462427.1 ferritin [Chitinophaga nivalis]MCW3487882.1 ferritin [Chitinophaga nivalis]